MTVEKEVLRFAATLTREPDSSATFLSIPVDIYSVWGTHARVPVKGTLNGTSFRGSIMPYGGVHYLGIKRDLREAIGIKAGDTIDVVLMVDDDPRVIEIPEDFRIALEANPAAKVRWMKLSYSHQREHVDAIESAVKPETRLKRIEDAIFRLQGKKK